MIVIIFVCEIRLQSS